MPLDTGTDYYYPNKMVRLLLLALEEVIGQNGVSAALNLAELGRLVNRYPQNTLEKQVNFVEVGGLMQALDDLYGPRAGRGVAQRAGNVLFRYAIREFGPSLGMADMSFRILPLNMKIKIGGQLLADTLNKFTDQVVRITEEPNRLLWQHVRCPLCWGRETDAPACHLAVGLLQESLYWVSGGKRFDVAQVSGSSCGDDICAFVVDKRPLD